LQNFLKDFHTANEHDIEYFLNEPVKHWPSYFQFFDELLKHTPITHADFHHLTIACQRIEQLNSKINFGIENSKKDDRMFEIVELLEDPSSILIPTRRYITEEIFFTKPHKHEKIVFLYNDLILIGDKHHNKIRESHRILLEDCQLVDLPNTPSEYSFQIKYNQNNDSITLITVTEQSKLTFTSFIKHQKELFGEQKKLNNLSV